MTPLAHTHLLKQLYQDAASRYEADIAPALAALAAHLLEWIPLRPADCVIDLGTGTGAGACLVASRVRRVVGIDLSTAMAVGTWHRRVPTISTKIAYACADAHTLPFSCAACDAVLAAFCFNETEPALAFREASRVLRPGGRLGLLEWGPPDALVSLVDETLAEFAVDDAHGFHAEMRALAAAVRPWDVAVSGCEDIADLLREAGFQDVRCEVVAGRVPFPDAEAFIRYALAWSPRRVEVEAMPAPRRDRFSLALRARLGAGELVWEPPLFRACAVKQDPA